MQTLQKHFRYGNEYFYGRAEYVQRSCSIFALTIALLKSHSDGLVQEKITNGIYKLVGR